MLQLSTDERRQLRARAHALNPVVSIAQNGLSDSVLKEIAVSLEAHELIKIRVYSDDRTQRESYLATVCEELGAAPVQHIGKLLVVWRPSAEAVADPAANQRAPAAAARTRARARARKSPMRTKRSFQS